MGLGETLVSPSSHGGSLEDGTVILHLSEDATVATSFRKELGCYGDASTCAALVRGEFALKTSH